MQRKIALSLAVGFAGAYLAMTPAGALGLIPAAASMGMAWNGAPMAAQDGWDAPPHELDVISQHGFKDGMEAARDDFNHRRSPDVRRHDTYKHPDVANRDKPAFRSGFERGYQVGMDHMMHEAGRP